MIVSTGASEPINGTPITSPAGPLALSPPDPGGDDVDGLSLGPALVGTGDSPFGAGEADGSTARLAKPMPSATAIRTTEEQTMASRQREAGMAASPTITA